MGSTNVVIGIPISGGSESVVALRKALEGASNGDSNTAEIAEAQRGGGGGTVDGGCQREEVVEEVK